MFVKDYKFVILNRGERELCKTPAQESVFAAIKSFTANGRDEVCLSLNDITSRCSVSRGHIPRVTKKLISDGLVEIVGNKTRIGGTSPIYKVSHHATPSVSPRDTLAPKVSHHATVSVSLTQESVSLPGTKPTTVKSNISNTTLLVQGVWEYYLQKSGTKEQLFPARKALIVQRLAKFTPAQIKQSIANCFTDKFYSGGSDRGWRADSDYIFRSDVNIDKLLNLKKPVEKLTWKNAPYD